MISDWVWAVFWSLIATVLITVLVSIWSYTTERDTKILNAKTCEQAALIKGGSYEPLNLLLCKLGEDFRIEKK